MKHTILVGAGIPICTVCAVIGSGFSLFIFGDHNEMLAENNIGISVENVLEVGSIKIKGDSTLILDGESSKYNKYGKGPYFTSNSGTHNEAHYSGAVSSDDGVSYVEGLTDLVFTIDFEIVGDLKNYINLYSNNLSLKSLGEGKYNLSYNADDLKDFDEDIEDYLLFSYEDMKCRYSDNFYSEINSSNDYNNILKKASSNSYIKTTYNMKISLK